MVRFSNVVAFAPCQPCLVLSTGGTTGNPKSILHCSETLVFAATRFSASLGFTEEEVHVGVAPYGHAGGSVFEMYMPLLHGAKILPIARWQAKPVAHAIEKFGGTFFITMGTHVFDMLALEPQDRARLKSVRLIFIGCRSPTSSSKRVSTSWASRSCASLGSRSVPVTPWDAWTTRAKYDYAKTACPLRELSIRLPRPLQMNPLTPDGTGEYLCRGPNLFMGYAGHAELTTSVVTSDGFYRSGDLVAMSANGYVNWMGRTKDIIRRGGLQIDPLEMEGMLDQHAKISQVVVVGEPDARLGERAVIVAVPMADTDTGRRRTLRISPATGPAEAEPSGATPVCQEIPRTEMGSSHRAEVQRRFIEEPEWANG